MIRREVIYFEEGGPEHTDTTIDLALKAARELGIGKVVVASTTGDSGVKVAERFKGTDIKVIVVGHQFGYPNPRRIPLQAREPEEAEGAGRRSLPRDGRADELHKAEEHLRASPMAFLTRGLIMAGVKVNVGVVVKAADAGLLMPGERVLSLAGSHQGLDTAVVIKA